jgi:hypothetical protein
MARKLVSPPVPPNAYIGSWNGANIAADGQKLFSAGAGDATPYELPGLSEADMVVLCVGSDDTLRTIEWQLVCVDSALVGTSPITSANTGLGQVIAVLSGVSTDAPTVRRVFNDNGASARVHLPLQFDIRGIPANRTCRWFLCAVSITSGAGNAFLFNYSAVGGRPL